MPYMTPITDLIARRTSVRAYTTQLIEPDKAARLNAFLASPPAGPFGTPMRFTLVTAKAGDAEALKGLGTYGQIKHPAGFIIGAMAATNTPEDFGYVMEQIILLATDLGLGTCWLGGSFQQSRFAEKMAVTPEETAPAAISIGYPAERLRFRDHLIAFIAKPRQRVPWDQIFFYDTFAAPLSQAQAGTYATAFEMVRIAPSANNKQPWRLVMAADQRTVHFYVQRAPFYAKQVNAGKMADLQRMDLGIAMCHFELTARESGLAGQWQAADPGLTPTPPATEYVASWMPS
jgi:nitroreductase